MNKSKSAIAASALTKITQQLALMQLADSSFPSGSFTLSHGLECLVQDGQLRGSKDLQTFLRLLLRNKVGVTDLRDNSF